MFKREYLPDPGILSMLSHFKMSPLHEEVPALVPPYLVHIGDHLRLPKNVTLPNTIFSIVYAAPAKEENHQSQR